MILVYLCFSFFYISAHYPLLRTTKTWLRRQRQLNVLWRLFLIKSFPLLVVRLSLKHKLRHNTSNAVDERNFQARHTPRDHCHGLSLASVIPPAVHDWILHSGELFLGLWKLKGKVCGHLPSLSTSGFCLPLFACCLFCPEAFLLPVPSNSHI